MIFIHAKSRKKIDCNGFTLAEMLIVVAIIAVLISVIVPTISVQLEKARETADLANIRSAISVVESAAIFDEPDSTNGVYYNSGKKYYYKKVPITQKSYNWVINNNRRSYTLFSGEQNIAIYYDVEDHQGCNYYFVTIYPATGKISIGPIK